MTAPKQITPHLWFDREAREASEFYTATFGKGSKVTGVTTLHDTPSGDCDVVAYTLADQDFMSISAGPLFRFNPSISFIVGCETAAEVDRLWETFSKGGKVLMELGEYPFSRRYGWLEDRYGLSWQLMLTTPEGDERPRIVPSLLFTGDRYGRAEEALKFYCSVFPGSEEGMLVRYGAGNPPNEEGTIMFADCRLHGTWLAIMDGAGEHDFSFNEAISFMVPCETQEQIDYYWGRLSAVPEAEQCGWLKDRFGVSWQIVPEALGEMMSKGTPEQIKRVTAAFLAMKKFDIAALRNAYEGRSGAGAVNT